MKLLTEDVQEIRRYSDTQEQIAEYFSVDEDMLGAIVPGTTFASLRELRENEDVYEIY